MSGHVRGGEGADVCASVFECMLLCVLSSGPWHVYVCVYVCELCKEELITEVAITSVDGYIETQTDYGPLPLPCPAPPCNYPLPLLLWTSSAWGHQRQPIDAAAALTIWGKQKTISKVCCSSGLACVLSRYSHILIGQPAKSGEREEGRGG